MLQTTYDKHLKVAKKIQYNVLILAVISTAVGGAVTNVGNSLLRKTSLHPSYIFASHYSNEIFGNFPVFNFIFFLNKWTPPNITKLILR